ncbi:protein FAR1-RELATED SEQUENCE 5-like [Humulus lupulus]|uniref:protein FAR1-RELATED SEQUENCE 5-like n=1 Tax=Humulus lupulus TaxID=3486 RepID=UPI002B410167|nr:protein FAR1-RELATED SEQUENCE 5-like [Humulus lupulus]
MVDVDTSSNPEWASIIKELNITKTVNELEKMDIVGKYLDSVDKWETFYEIYAKWMGFGKRSDDVKRRNGVVSMRTWVCTREGYRRSEYVDMPNRKKRSRPITRSGCQAALRVVHMKDNDLWMVKEFSHEHNHEIVSVPELQFLKNNHVVSDGLLAQVRSMNSVGIKTSQIMSHIAMQSGGYERMPCQVRDVYNRVAGAIREEKLETNAEGALGFLDFLSVRDPNFFVYHQADTENRLANVFWADGTARIDYRAFGDVIAFDTTYMTNTYNKPLCILMGVNHHFSTFVVTDGDNAMREAIKEILPESTHRLCAWHLSTNASRAGNDPRFTKAFNNLMNSYYNEEVFENKWKELMETYQMEENEWCQLQCKRKRMWAETYLHGHFVVGMRTTQRCESMNFCLKKFLLKRYTLREFVTAIDIAVTKIRHIERENEFTTKHTLPNLPSSDALSIYYDQCAKFYTWEMYYKVESEIKRENAYFISSYEDHANHTIFNVGNFRDGQTRYKVTRTLGTNHFECNFLFYETNDYPCRHIWAMMKSCCVRIIPNSLLLKRWSLHAKSHPENMEISQPIQEESVHCEMSRFGALNSDATMMNFYASKSPQYFNTAKEEISRLTAIFKEGMDIQGVSQGTSTRRSYRENPNIMQEPVRVRTKGQGNPGQ